MQGRREELARLYSELFVECSDEEVKRLYFLLSLFFAKCDGLVSNSEVRQMMSDSEEIPFDPYSTPVTRRDMILVRLKFLKKYGVNNPREIIRVLTWGLFTTERFNPSDRRYLVEFIENPDKPFSWFANKLGVSTSSVFEAYSRLRDKIQFRFTCGLNYPLFKLRHFLLFFKPNEMFRGSMLSRDFTLSLNKDTFSEWMWASFVVPNQTRTLREFTDGIKKLSFQAFDDSGLYEVKSMGKSCNISLFDGEKWIPSEDVLGVGSVRFAERAGEILPCFSELTYGDKPIRFDEINFLIACLRYVDSRSKNSEIRSVLRKSGFDLSWVTISKRLTSMNRAGVFMPTFAFWGLGLTIASTFAIECEDSVTGTLYQAFPQFPECTASRTNKGVVFMIRTTPESAAAISYLLQSSLKERVDRLIVANRLENIGSRIPSAFYTHWNSDKQYWEFDRGYFDLMKEPQK